MPSTDPEYWPKAEGVVTVPNGAATIKRDGEYRLSSKVRTYRPNEEVILEASSWWHVDEGGSPLDAEFEMTPSEAVRLGHQLLEAAAYVRENQ